MKARVVVAIAVAALAVVACDPRACLAYSPLFSGFRADLIDQCCTCLAHNGTRHPGAACAETFIDADGGLAILADAGPAIPIDAGPDVPPDDADNKIEPGEVPCLCEDGEDSCRAALTAGAPILVTGSCISQGSGLLVSAPCEDACKGVLTFSPLSTEQP